MSVRGNTGCPSHLSCSAQLQLHQGNGAAVGCIPPAGCSLEVHPPGEAPQAGFPAALSQQALPHPDSLALPEARKCGGLFGSHPSAALPLSLGCEEGLQLGMVHVCCSDRLRDGGKEDEEDRLRRTMKLEFCSSIVNMGYNFQDLFLKTKIQTKAGQSCSPNTCFTVVWGFVDR